jgi:hypothetical protein
MWETARTHGYKPTQEVSARLYEETSKTYILNMAAAATPPPPPPVAPYTPVTFLRIGAPNTLTFLKDEHAIEYKRSRLIYSLLHEKGCVEVRNILSMTLTNAIHAIFPAAKFESLSAAGYAEIRPAVTLASRFITEPEYLGFWTHLGTGIMERDTRPLKRTFETARDLRKDANCPASYHFRHGSDDDGGTGASTSGGQKLYR